MAEVAWTPDAEADLREIYRFVARDSPSAGAYLILRLVNSAGRLGDHPLSGRVVPEYGNERIREVLTGAYRIIYRLRGDRVDIARVLHGARLIKAGDIVS